MKLREQNNDIGVNMYLLSVTMSIHQRMNKTITQWDYNNEGDINLCDLVPGHFNIDMMWN